MITTEKAPELYSRQDAVPLGSGEKAMALKIRVTLDGGYDENHFYVPIGRYFPVRDIDIRSGVEVGSSNAWVNSRDYIDYLNNMTEEKAEDFQPKGGVIYGFQNS